MIFPRKNCLRWRAPPRRWPQIMPTLCPPGLKSAPKRARKTMIQIGKNPMKLAEREGFEPSVPVTQYARLAIWCLRPLGHLSARGNQAPAVLLAGRIRPTVPSDFSRRKDGDSGYAFFAGEHVLNSSRSFVAGSKCGIILTAPARRSASACLCWLTYLAEVAPASFGSGPPPSALRVCRTAFRNVE